jgi:hypothetical protein
MENNSNNKEQLPGGVGSNSTGAESAQHQENDREFIKKVQVDEPDAIKKPENSDEVVGDVDPTTRVEISQEQQNGDSQKQSESSKIAGVNSRGSY